VRTARARVTGAALATLAFVSGCVAPAPPPADEAEEKPPIVLHTEAHDRKAGEQAAEDVAAEMGILEAPELTRYVERVGQRVVRAAPRGDFEYHFQIVDQDVPNAFALPGGYVYVSRGLLVLSNSEDELANVLAHEVVHVANRHAAARQSMMGRLPALFQYALMRQLTAYGRDQEREADRLGQELAAAAGYDPNGMVTFLKQLEFTERLQLGSMRTPGYFDTHPTTGERVSSAGARARAIQWEPALPLEPDHEAYLRRLEGLVVGTAATEGVFEGDRFLHPDLGFSMRFPADWDVLNTRRAVGAVSPRRDAQVYLELEGEGTDPQAASIEYLERAAREGLRVDESRPVRIGELDAYRVEGRASAPGTLVSVHLTWIAREGRVYRLTGVAMGSAGRLEGVFNNVARSFRPIKARELASIRETRVRVVPAQEGESLAELSQRTHNEWNIQQTAVMNDVFANDRLTAGQPVKIAVSHPYRPARAR
jgi:predicted Zn-dependent protease